MRSFEQPGRFGQLIDRLTHTHTGDGIRRIHGPILLSQELETGGEGDVMIWVMGVHWGNGNISELYANVLSIHACIDKYRYVSVGIGMLYGILVCL